MPKNALGQATCPPFFGAWIQPSSDLCIFTQFQKKKYSTPHLLAGGWYLECPFQFTPDEEVELRTSLLGIDPAPPTTCIEDDVVHGPGYSSSPPVVLEEGTSSKRKRLSKADKAKLEKEEAARIAELEKNAAVERAVAEALAKVAAANPSPGPSLADVTADDDIEGYSPPIMVSQAAGSSYIEVSRHVAEKRKQQQFNASDSSMAPITTGRIESFIQNASVHNIMDTLEHRDGPSPLWQSLHDFISRVCDLSHSMFFVFTSYLSLVLIVSSDDMVLFFIHLSGWSGEVPSG